MQRLCLQVLVCVIGSADLLPGWVVFKGTNQVTNILINASAPEASFVTLITQGDLAVVGRFHVDGPYALMFRQYRDDQDYALIQEAGVPLKAQVLAYKFQSSAFFVTANGEVLPVVATYGAIPGISA